MTRNTHTQVYTLKEVHLDFSRKSADCRPRAVFITSQREGGGHGNITASKNRAIAGGGKELQARRSRRPEIIVKTYAYWVPPCVNPK